MQFFSGRSSDTEELVKPWGRRLLDPPRSIHPAWGGLGRGKGGTGLRRSKEWEVVAEAPRVNGFPVLSGSSPQPLLPAAVPSRVVTARAPRTCSFLPPSALPATLIKKAII